MMRYCPATRPIVTISTPTTVTLADLYLVPGDHLIRIGTTGGDYTLTLTPLGPPDPTGEREPNNDAVSAQPIVIGQPLDGRLPQVSDRDVFRFSLAAREHLALTVTPPSDGSMTYSLSMALSTILADRVATLQRRRGRAGPIAAAHPAKLKRASVGTSWVAIRGRSGPSRSGTVPARRAVWVVSHNVV